MGQMPNSNGQCYCQKQNKWLKEGQFYTYKDGTKTEMCKKCLTLHIDNFDPDTFLWLLQKMDVPYVPAEWNVLRDRAFAKDPNKMNGMSVFGKYLSKMKLKQWKNFGWADSEKLQAMNQQRRVQDSEEAAAADAQFEEQLKAKFAAGEITEAQYKTLMPTPIQNQDFVPTASSSLDEQVSNPYQEDNFLKQTDLPDPASELTQQDKMYLAMKWGRLYKPSEWIELEQNYKRMTDSFDIQDADTENSLILYCKNNLKMNQALDCGDLDGYNKISRTQDSLRKSSKFAAKDRQKSQDNAFDSVGELVAYCEKMGGEIPRYELEVDYDIVDTIINDLKSYTRTLIYQDPALAREIEDHLKRKENLEQEKKDKAEAKARGLDDVQLTDDDIMDYNERIESEREQDAQMIKKESE